MSVHRGITRAHVHPCCEGLHFSHLAPSDGDGLLLKITKLISGWPVSLATEAEVGKEKKRKKPGLENETVPAELAAFARLFHLNVSFCVLMIKVRKPFRTFVETYPPRSGLKLPSRSVYCQDAYTGGNTQKFFTHHG